jgi:hypothetical protein
MPQMTREEIVRALEAQQIEGEAYWNAFDTAAFFEPIGQSWSPAEAVRHLTKSTRPVAKALRLPRIALRLMFRGSGRASVTYDELVARYQRLLAEGGQAGSYAPSPRSQDDLETWRQSIMGEFAAVQRDVRATLRPWSEKQLDALQLPHPLLGKLTVREMLFFTLYHLRHHVAVVKRRIAERH